ncbi:hypothetical protein GCM10027290_23840 [Micromonospora sonneratiae]
MEQLPVDILTLLKEVISAGRAFSGRVLGGFLRYRAVPVWVLVLLRSAGGQALAPSLREHVDPRVHVSIVDLRSPSLYTTRAHPNAWAVRRTGPRSDGYGSCTEAARPDVLPLAYACISKGCR